MSITFSSNYKYKLKKITNFFSQLLSSSACGFLTNIQPSLKDVKFIETCFPTIVRHSEMLVLVTFRFRTIHRSLVNIALKN